MRFIDHNGTQILLSDLSGIRTIPELQRAVRLGGELLQTQAPNSVLVLVDLTGVEYNLESFAIVQQSVAANRPFVRARAIVGLPSEASDAFEVVARVSDSPMEHFASMEEAKDWLASLA